jgi:hypothetical protein
MNLNTKKAPRVQGRGWGGASRQALLAYAPTPNPSPEGEGL